MAFSPESKPQLPDQYSTSRFGLLQCEVES